MALINGAGLSDWDKDGLLEQDTAVTNMWRGDCAANLSLEFELAEPVALGSIEVWNYNAHGRPLTACARRMWPSRPMGRPGKQCCVAQSSPRRKALQITTSPYG